MSTTVEAGDAQVADGTRSTMTIPCVGGAIRSVVNRAGQTTVDMANSPEQRTQPFPETIKLLGPNGRSGLRDSGGATEDTDMAGATRQKQA
jgi:hypothetical protein